MILTFIASAWGFFKTPLGKYVAGAGIVLAILLGFYVAGRLHGGTAAVERIEKQNEAVKKATGKEVDKVKACFARGEPWEWDTSTGTCAKMENTK